MDPLTAIREFVRRILLRNPCLYHLVNRLRFRKEIALLKGRDISTGSHQSILHFAINKSATQFTKSILVRCAPENSLTAILLNQYAFHSDFPILESLPPHEMQRYAHVFRPKGYLYTVFEGPFSDGPVLDDYLILLTIRDPRDVLTSTYYSLAYSHPPPGGKEKLKDFLERKAFALEAGIDRLVLSQEAEFVLDVYQKYADSLLGRPNVHVATYENMVSDFGSWLDAVLAHCDLQISKRLRQRLLTEAKNSHPKRENVSKHVRQVIPGDHLRKLRPETIKELNALFADVLKAFQYG